MATQREDIEIRISETGADQAVSKVGRLNDAIGKLQTGSKSATIDIKSLGSSVTSLASGTGDVVGTVQQLAVEVGSAANAFAQTAVGAAIAGNSFLDYKRASEQAAAATAELAAKEKLYAEAKAARDALRNLPRAARGSDEAAERSSIRQAADDAYRSMRLAQIAKESSEAEVAATGFLRSATLGLVGLTAAAATAYLGLEAISFNARKMADETDEMARKLGISTERLQALQYVADGGAGTVEGLTRVFDKLGRSMQKADEDNAKTEWAFKSLGISMEEVGKMSEEQLAVKLVQNYELLGRTTKATVAIQQLLGPSFRDQIPAILDLGNGLDNYVKKVNDFGAVASPALVKAGQEQDDALKDLGLAWRGLSNEIAESTGTIVKSIVEGLSTALNAIRTTLAEMRKARDEAKSTEAIPQADRNAMLKQARNEVYDGSNPNATEGDVNRRFKELLAQRKQQEAENEREIARLNARSQAARAADVQALAATAGNAPDKTASKTDTFADAREALRRQLALTQQSTEYEKVLFETQEGRYRLLLPKQKEELLGLAQQADARDKLNKKAEAQLKLMKEYDEAEQDANNRLQERIAYENQLAVEQAKRLTAAARATRQSTGIQNTPGLTSNTRQDQADLANVANAAQDAIDRLSPYLQDYEKRVKGIRAAEQDATDAIRESAKAREKYASDWTNGAKDAFANYLEDASNVAGKTQKLFESSFGKAEDALVEFVTTGKLNFKSFVASILTDIAHYLIQVAVMAPIIASLKAMMGFADGGVFSAGAPTGFAKGGAFSGGRVTPFANGGVVSSPTLFPMTGGVGLMGEAGPEAIMPLDRDPMGRLGVKAMGMGVTNNTYAINVSIGSVDSDERQTALIKAFESVVETKTKQTLVNEMRRGNILNRRK